VPDARTGYPRAMARGEHPQRTPFYGACMLAAAFLSCGVAARVHTAWLSGAIYVAAAVAACIGLVMTLRDYG
jgi:hypothetical protein